MRAAVVVEEEHQGNGVGVVLRLLAESVGEAREAPVAHPDRQV